MLWEEYIEATSGLWTRSEKKWSSPGSDYYSVDRLEEDVVPLTATLLFCRTFSVLYSPCQYWLQFALPVPVPYFFAIPRTVIFTAQSSSPDSM